MGSDEWHVKPFKASLHLFLRGQPKGEAHHEEGEDRALGHPGNHEDVRPPKAPSLLHAEDERVEATHSQHRHSVSSNPVLARRW